MRNGFVSSALLHVSILIVAYYGVPALFEPDFTDDHPIVVDLVTISHKTSLPKPSPPQEKPKREPSAERQTASLPETPAPVPAPAPKRTKKAVKDMLAKLTPPKPRPKPKPKLKPKPAKVPDPFASVLKTVEKLRQKETKTSAAKLAPQVIHAPRRFDPSTTLSLSEMDAIRSQISRCWIVPVGARNAEDLVVNIKVYVNPDGTIRKATILDRDRMNRDAFFRSAAESAYRAVKNKECSPLRLPPEKYEYWKTFTLSFNPKEMLGT